MNVCEALSQLIFAAFLLGLVRTENFEVYKQLMEAEGVTRINTNVNHETFQQVSRKFERIIDLLGDWDLHLHSSEKILAWFHAYNHFNYACQVSYYWASQQALQDSHLQMYEHFQRDDFSVRRMIGNFNKISLDQVIKQTINKDQKGSGE